MKHIHRESLHVMKHAMPHVFTKNTPQGKNFTPSHLSSFSINVSLSVLSLRIILSLTFNSFFDAHGLTLGSSH
jgi:hypothetical protein